MYNYNFGIAALLRIARPNLNNSIQEVIYYSIQGPFIDIPAQKSSFEYTNLMVMSSLLGQLFSGPENDVRKPPWLTEAFNDSPMLTKTLPSTKRSQARLFIMKNAIWPTSLIEETLQSTFMWWFSNLIDS